MKRIRELSEADFLRLFFALVSLVFLVAAVCMPDRNQMLWGLWQVISQPSKLSTNYFAVGGYAATFLNIGLVGLISLALSVYMTVISIQFTITQFEGGNTSIAIAIPIWVIYLSTCIGFFLMSYVYLRKLGSLLKKKAAQETGEEEAAC